MLLAAIAGDRVGCLCGHRFWPRMFSRTDSRFFSTAHARRPQALFAEHGLKAVVLAPPLASGPTFTPVVAGVARLPRRRFTACNVAGACALTTWLLTAGFYLGHGVSSAALAAAVVTHGQDAGRSTRAL